MEYTIDNGTLCVTANSFGAELISVKCRGEEKLWQNSTGEWSGHSPVLFPVCGRCFIKHKGVEYPQKFHGVCRHSEFTLTDRGDDFLEFTLQSNAETREVYPFDFTFSMVYRVHGSTLLIEHVVKNENAEPMYFACGGHESFNLATNVEDYAIEFEKEEELRHRLYDSESRLLGAEDVVWFEEKTFLPLPLAYLQKGDTLILEKIRSRKVWLCEKNGKRLAEICFADEMGNLLLWRAGNSPFICIEPWSNLPDAADETLRKMEFSQKLGVMKLDAGATKILKRSVKYL